MITFYKIIVSGLAPDKRSVFPETFARRLNPYGVGFFAFASHNGELHIKDVM